MSQNKISATLSATDKTDILAAIANAKAKLPFLVNLTPEENRRSRKMGAKSVQYVNMNLQGALSFADTLPASIDVDEFGRDVNLVNQLLEIRLQLASLLEAIEDTVTSAGSDAVKTSDTVYGYLKIASKNNPGLKALVDEISTRFDGQGRKKATQPA